MSLLEVKNLDFGFNHSQRMGFLSRKKIVLHNITFSLQEGEALGIIGESGSGKTTLARCVAGLLTPTNGTIEFDDINIYPETNNRKMLGSKIQLVFQAYSASLDPQLTIEHIILEGFQVRRNVNRIPLLGVTAKELCSLVGLPKEILNSYPFQLSGGQKQRVALARAISVQPRLIILDEPTSALDVLTQAHILGLIKRIRSKHALGLIFITHNIVNSMLLCDRIAVLHRGSIVETGDTKEIGENPSHPYTKHLLYSSS
jgi:ABC-type dipeptide/oligopeptide/nickel transport system ATPase subunit